MIIIPNRNYYNLNPPENFAIEKPTPQEWLENMIAEHEQERASILMFDAEELIINERQEQREPVPL